MNKISIIIPIYNTAEFLEECISSVLSQSYQNFEMILINDNSSDNSKHIIEKFTKKENKIKAYHLEKRHGVGATRNYGIEMASGDFLYFLDSDDYLPKNTLQLLIENINSHDMIFGRVQRAHLSEQTTDDRRIGQGRLEHEIDVYTEKKFDLIKNNLILNILFKKSFLQKNKLRFSESVERYSELFLIIPALLKVEKVPLIGDCLYFKRKRNDPLSNPSLMQTGMEDKINDFCYVYNNLKEYYTDRLVVDYLDQQLLQLYRRIGRGYFRKNENVDNIFTILNKSLNRLHVRTLNSQPYFLKKEISILKSGDINRYKKFNLWRHRIIKLRKSLKGRRSLYIQIYRSIFLKTPVKEDLVVFESFLGKSYSDSPKYIYEKMLDMNLNYKYVWIFNKKKSIPGNAIQVKRFSLKYFYYMARAKYWISNSRLPKSLNKREENIYLQTWHGTPLKKLVFDMKDVHSADPSYKRNFYIQSRRWDFLSSPNNFSSNVFKRAFKYEKDILEYGYPRNDILYTKNTAEDIMDLKKKMNLSVNKKVILYAPTWRDDQYYSRGKYKFDLELDLKKLEKHFGQEYVILLRMHYFIASELDISEYRGFVYDFSQYEDIAELYLISDILITDYSSVFFDYANLKRPILFFMYDIERYRDKLRGFYLDIENEIPGPLLKTNNEIIKAIKDIENIRVRYKEKYNLFYEKYCKWDDGNASERTVNRIFGK